MSFRQEEFTAYLMRKKKRNAKRYCSELLKIERKFKLGIDEEYIQNRFDTLLKALKNESRKSRFTDCKASKAFRTMRRVLRRYSAFLKSIGFSSVKADVENKYAVDPDWSLKDAMVGTVRNAVQLDCILKTNSYHVPAIHLTEDNLPIRYIALYEQGIGSKPGIHRYGEVLSMRKMKRKKINVPLNRDNGNETYYYFRVRCWNELPRTIDIRDTKRGVPLFTSKFLLDNCTQSYQLFSVSSKDDYVLMTAINSAFDDMFGSEHNTFSAVYQINKIYSLRVSQGCFEIANKNAEILDTIPLGSFCYRPKDSFDRLKKIISIKE